MKRFKKNFRFQREVYNNLNNSQYLRKFQVFVYDFMKKVRANFFENVVDLQFMNDFCVLIDNDNV